MAKTVSDREYLTVRDRSENSFIEKKSEFIGYLCPVTTEKEATDFIAEIRAANRKARHNCYAYILRDSNTVRHSDDGEPAGTAGAPMLEVLSNNALTDVVCVVTRYFGGILLGTGGLVRAYSKAASLAVEAADVIKMKFSDVLTITSDYSYYGPICNVVAENGGKIMNSDFSQNVIMTVLVDNSVTEKFIEAVNDRTCGKNVINVISSGFNEF